MPGKGAVSIQRTADPHLETLKLLKWNEPPLKEPEGVGLGPVHVAKKAHTEPIECAVANMRRPGKVLLDANIYGTPAPAEGTASVELAGRAIKATTAQPKALDPWAKSEAWHGLGTPPLLLLRMHPGMLGMPLWEAPNEGMHRHRCKALPLPPLLP